MYFLDFRSLYQFGAKDCNPMHSVFQIIGEILKVHNMHKLLKKKTKNELSYCKTRLKVHNMRQLLKTIIKRGGHNCPHGTILSK
jgi:hypothetical protein